MLMLGLILFGAMSFQRMGISQLPDVDFPVINVSIAYPGASPEVMETDVADIVEDALMTVEGVQSVTSTSRYEVTNVTLEMDLNRNIDAALQEVQGKITQITRRLPTDIDPPIISKNNPDDQPILWLALYSSQHSKAELMRFVRDQLKDQFSTVAGVGEVILGGYVEPSLRVWIDSHALNRYDLTVVDLLSTIQGEHAELPAGQIEDALKESNVRTMGEARSLEEFQSIIVNRRGNQPNFSSIPLRQVAKIEEGLGDVRRISRYNGEIAVGLGIKKQRGSNAVDVAQLVKKRMKAVEGNLPPGMSINVNFDTTRFIEQSIHGLNTALLLAAVFTALVCWMFLGSWSSTFNVLMAIPTSIIGAFIGLYAFGFTLNTFTLLGLSLAIGIVVDDAIMVLENIIRHREMGKTRLEAAKKGAREIAFAAMAATIAIVAIFLPVAFMKGVIGKFFFQFGITMTITVLLSLLEALTLTPMRCSQFVETPERTTRIGRAFEALLNLSTTQYQKLLGPTLKKRYLVVIGSLLFFALSLASVKNLNKEFVPAQDQSVFLGRIQTPVESSLAFTDSKSQEVENYFRSLPEVSHVFSAVGGFTGGEVNTGIVFVSLKPVDSRGKNDSLGRERTQIEIMDSARKDLKKIDRTRVSLQDLSMRGFSASRGYPVEFSIRGSDWNQLSELSQKIGDELEKTGLVTDLDTDYKHGKPEIRIIPKRQKAAERGVSIRDISETVSAMIGGVSRGRYAMGGHRYEIRVRLQEVERNDLERIKNLYVRNNRGVLVQLSEVIEIQQVSALQQITRYDRERAIKIFANVATGKSQAQAIETAERIGKQLLPPGYRIVISGSAQSFKESFQDLTVALVLGIVIAYMVLGSQFNSFIDPITVLMALPFSISGAFIALWLGGISLNIYSFIGLILLMGIVKKNSILLVEFTHQVRKTKPHLTTDQALIEACPIRLRPILMTSVATVAAAIPEAIPYGPGYETRIPMAVSVIGGVLISTVLTLFVVPAVYSIFSSLRAKRLIQQGSSEPLPHSAEQKVSTVLTWFVLIMGGLGCTSSWAMSEPLALSQAIQNALETGPSLEPHRNQIRQNEALLSSRISDYFPTLQLIGNSVSRKDAVNNNIANFAGEPYNLYQLQIQGNFPIFRGFQQIASQSVAQHSFHLAELDFRLAKMDLEQDVLRAYFTILLHQERLNAFYLRLKLDTELLSLARRREKIGRSQRIEVLQIESQLALFRPQVDQAKNAMELAIAELKELTATQNKPDPMILGELHRITPQDLLLTEHEKRLQTEELFEFQRSESLVRQTSSQTQVDFAKHLPTFDAVGTYSRNSFSKIELSSSYSTSWSLGLQLNIPLFSGLSWMSDRRAFLAREAAAEKQLEITRNSLFRQLEQTDRNLKTAFEIHQTSTDAHLLSRTLLATARKDYSLYLLDYQQLLNIQRDALQAELNWIQSKFDHIIASAQWIRTRSLNLSQFIQRIELILSKGKASS